MGASALHLVPHYRRHQTGAVSDFGGVNGEALILLGVGIGSVAGPVMIAQAMGASTVVMIAVGVGAFMVLLPFALVTAGLYMEQG